MNDRKTPISGVTFRENVEACSSALERWANRLDLQRCSYGRREARQWKTRESQKTLRWVAQQLMVMSKHHPTDYGLYKGLVEYLHCLMTSQEDVRIFQLHPCKQSERWKAQGEAHVLSRICTQLSRVIDAHVPAKDPYTLSLDGRRIVSFPTGEEEPVPVEHADVPCVLKRGWNLRGSK